MPHVCTDNIMRKVDGLYIPRPILWTLNLGCASSILGKRNLVCSMLQAIRRPILVMQVQLFMAVLCSLGRLLLGAIDVTPVAWRPWNAFERRAHVSPVSPLCTTTKPIFHSGDNRQRASQWLYSLHWHSAGYSLEKTASRVYTAI